MAPIRVNCVSHGAVHTELFARAWKEREMQMVEMYKAKTLLKQIGRPEDIAEAYLYLMKDSFVTGVTLLSDGGYVLV